MMGMTEENKAKLWERIPVAAGQPMSDKDIEVLTGILHSESFIKALGRVYGIAHEMPTTLLRANLSDPNERNEAIKIQGMVQGYLNAIELLLDLTVLPEGDEDVSPASTDS